MTVTDQTPKNSIAAAVYALWNSLAHDPARQALETTRFCLAHAPQLAAWVEAQIYAQLPDRLLKALLFQTPASDGRLAALTLLAQARTPLDVTQALTIRQSAERRLAEQPRPQPQRRRGKSPQKAFEALTGVALTILPAQESQPIRVDWELGRLAIALALAHQFRLWALGREITRRGDGSGVITRRSLWQMLQGYRIAYTRRHFNRLLVAGNGLFWRSAGKKLYLAGISTVARRMTALAVAAGIPTEHNLPGNREALLDPAGSLEQWEGMLYAGWIAGRSEKGHGDVTISRAALESLFGRDETTLRRWEQTRLAHVVTIRENVAQSVAEESDIGHLPAHAQPYLARIKTPAGPLHLVRVMWQLPNTYHANISTHAHKGQASKVRKAVISSLHSMGFPTIVTA